MPSPKVDAVMLGFEVFNRGDWDAASNVREDFEWINDPETSRMTATPARANGPGELREFWDAFFSQWEEFRMDPGEPLESESGTVVVPVRFTGRGRGSGVPIEWDYFQVWEFADDGRPLRISNIRDRAAAMAAAGVADQSSQA
jgi:ketosteroid isomerase-like protein